MAKSSLLIRDRDSKFTRDFNGHLRKRRHHDYQDTGTSAENGIAERFVRAVRSECLDWLLIVNRRHLERVLRVFVDHYNSDRPHRSLNLTPP